MKSISERTIAAVASVIAGDPTSGGKLPVSPYRSGPQLVEFFNEFAHANLIYGAGFGTRIVVAKEQIREINGTDRLARVIEQSVSPANFTGSDFTAEAAVAYLNEFLAFDELELRKESLTYRLIVTSGVSIVVNSALSPLRPLDHMYIEEQIAKCDAKLRSADYDGAITNARTMLEALLLAIDSDLSGVAARRDGDIVNYYKRVQKLLNLEPSQSTEDKALPDSLQMVLRGLISCVQGIASARNAMGDAHARSFKAEQRHAQLVINATKTVADFLLSSFEYRRNLK